MICSEQSPTNLNYANKVHKNHANITPVSHVWRKQIDMAMTCSQTGQYTEIMQTKWHQWFISCNIGHQFIFYPEPVKFWWGSMFLFFECFQTHHVLVLFLFSMKNCYLLIGKVTPDDRTYGKITKDDFDSVQVIILYVNFRKNQIIILMFSSWTSQP